MRYPSVSALVISAAVMSGCVSQHPQTAEEFREAVRGPDVWSAKFETFEVNRPFQAVAKSFRKHAKKCLAVTIRTVESGARHHAVYTTTYKPTLVVNGKRAELHVQHHIDNTIKITAEPPGGYYMMVVDAYPVGKNKTRIDLYRPSMGFSAMIRGVKAWARGKNGCPDLTKNGLL